MTELVAKAKIVESNFILLKSKSRSGVESRAAESQERDFQNLPALPFSAKSEAQTQFILQNQQLQVKTKSKPEVRKGAQTMGN